MRCDGSSDCKDHSDEDGCVSRVTCAADQHRCLNSEQCVLQEWLCDGQEDCRDASDEQVTPRVHTLGRGCVGPETCVPSRLSELPVGVELYGVRSAVWSVPVAVCVPDSVRSSELAL